MNKVSKYLDVIAGAFMFLVSVAMIIGSMTIEQRAASSAVGPDFMPKIIGITLVIISIMIIITGLRNIRKREIYEKNEFTREEGIPVLFTIAALMLYVAMLPILGFIVSTIAYLFVQFILVDCDWKENVFKYALIAVVTSLSIYFIFRYLFVLILPTGILF